MMTPTAAVIIPTFNRWPHVRGAIDSVLSQTWPSTTCLVVDDASTDGSYEKLAAEYGHRIMLRRNEVNRQKSFTRNRGIRECQAEYLCFLDSDDVLTADSVEARIALFRDDPAFGGVAYGINVSPDPLGAKKASSGKVDEAEDLLAAYVSSRSGLHTNSFMIRSDIMLRYGMFNERLTNGEDIELLVRLLCLLEFRPCGRIVSRMRVVDQRRARHDHDAIIRQGMSMSMSLAANDAVRERLGPLLRKIRKREYSALLKALYLSGRRSEFRSRFRAGWVPGLTPKTWRGVGWYVASLLADGGWRWPMHAR